MTIYNISIAKTLTGGHIKAWNAVITKKQSSRTNILSLIVASGNNITIGDEINFYDLNNIFVFAGIVQKPKDNTGYQQLEIADYSIVLSQININEVFTSGNTYADVIEYIIDTYTDFTFINELGITTPTIQKNLIRRDVWAIDVINELINVFNGTFSVDKNKVFTLCQNNSTINSSSLENGVDSLIGGWETDNNKKAEYVIVKGANIDQRTTETLIGTGTEFYTTYIPENIEINGLTQTTETIDGDYEVDKPNKKITFDTSKTDPIVSYTYKSQVRVEIGDPEGKTVVLEKSYIESKKEARKLAREYIDQFIDGAQSSKWMKSRSSIDDFNVGEQIPVIDTINNYNGNYKINNVQLKYPNQMYITIGEDEEDLFDWQKESIKRIKNIEAKDQNADFITKDFFITNNLKVSVSCEFTELKSIVDNGTILWASDTTLSTNADLISDIGLDEDFALAYDDNAITSNLIIDWLSSEVSNLLLEDGNALLLEDGEYFILE